MNTTARAITLAAASPLALLTPTTLASTPLTYDQVAADFDFVTVGDPGNPAYHSNDFHFLATVGRGSVDYGYQITRSEVSTAEYFRFYDTFSTHSDELEAAISPSAWGVRAVLGYHGPGRKAEIAIATNPYAELSPLSAKRPSALMYANWLHNGQTSDVADLYHGAYNFDPVTGDAPLTHEPDARFRLPTADEYLKAVYYDPDKNDQGPGWWQYGHTSDEPAQIGLPSQGGHMDFGLTLDELRQDLPGLNSTGHVPLYAYEHVVSPWGLTDITTGRREFLGVVEEIYAPYWQPGRLQVWGFPNGMLNWSLTEMQPANPPGGFRIVTVVPAPGVPAMGAICVLALLGPKRRT